MFTYSASIPTKVIVLPPTLTYQNPKIKSEPRHSYSTYAYLLFFSVPLLDMDTLAGPSNQSLCADITWKYEDRVATITKKVDPNCAKARVFLSDIDNLELEEVEGTVSAPTQNTNEAKVAYMEALFLTLRDLMPGSTGVGNEDRELDQSFRADKI